ncbi:hypothetical protein YC2023_081913 [Brassica napus]
MTECQRSLYTKDYCVSPSLFNQNQLLITSLCHISVVGYPSISSPMISLVLQNPSSEFEVTMKNVPVTVISQPLQTTMQ